MKVKQILSIKEIADDKRLPCDMYELYNTKYMSVSRDEMISIEDMDIVHLIRAFKNDRHRLANQLTDDDLLRQIRDLVSANKELGKQLDQEVRNDTQEGRIVPLVQENLSLSRQRDSWKEKAMNMMEKSSYDDLKKQTDVLVKDNSELRFQIQQVDRNQTVSKEAYDIAWDNNKMLKKQVEHWKKLAEDNFIASINDSETSDTWKDRYDAEVKNAEYWKAQYRIANDLLQPKGCGYMFSEIPNDTDGQEFVDTMKQYFNKKSYKMRVRGQHIKPELKGTGATYSGQSIDESTHLRVYIDVK